MLRPSLRPMLRPSLRTLLRTLLRPTLRPSLRTLLAAVAALSAGCSSTAVTSVDPSGDDLTVAGNIDAQSFLHGTVAASKAQVAYAFNGSAGDTIAPDVWPTGDAKANGLRPTLVLLGPKGLLGHRSALASGARRDGGDHVAIDGFKLPRAGSYLILVGGAAAGSGGAFTLRLWTLSSHAPRPEAAQLDLSLAPSVSTRNLVAAHGQSGALANTPWTDGEVDGALAGIQTEADPIAAFSDTEQLLAALSSAARERLASDAQRARAQQASVQLVGTPADFAQRSSREQAFALFWLGTFGGLTFESVDAPPGDAALAPVDGQISRLVASWPGASEDHDAHEVKALRLGQTTFGYVASWQAVQSDTDGSGVFAWVSTDFFDANGQWLGEQSQGASEPDDG